MNREKIERQEGNVYETGYFRNPDDQFWLRHSFDDEPAVINYDTGEVEWYKDGINHREEGKPARYNPRHGKEVYIVDGVMTRNDGPAYIEPRIDYERYMVNGLLHRLDGPAIYCGSSGKIAYFVEGVRVPEKVVMDPLSQTPEEILNENNLEIRRLRASQYGGWIKVFDALEESNITSETIDYGDNDIEQTKEAIVQVQELRFFIGSCKSSGRIYAMEIDPNISTISDARQYLGGGLDPNRCVLAT